jgi:hypothetical protein
MSEDEDIPVDNEALIRHLYSVTEVKDFQGFVELFTEDGTVPGNVVGCDAEHVSHETGRSGFDVAVSQDEAFGNGAYPGEDPGGASVFARAATSGAHGILRTRER